ncbi:TdeIII family type II restriction endonuclease, partial [Candidatus Micrarchaeota archaeon]|nr:TdeIII family type II restriction endonuclease [Candidatus Micrarchaeota archaeon]
MIKPATREKIKGYLEGFIQGIVNEHKTGTLKPTDIRPTATVSEDGNIKPFHEALLPDGILRINEFERSFSTRLGTTFEETAKLIALDVHGTAARSKAVTGKVPKSALAFIEKTLNSTDKKGIRWNYTDLVSKIAKFKGPKSERTSVADLFVRTKFGMEMYFEIKSPKPNKGQCLEVTERLLKIQAIQRARPKVRTYFAMAYNPYGDNRKYYKHSFT